MLDIVRLLIENGVDFNGRNVNGKKARDYLISNYQGAHKNEIKNLLGWYLIFIHFNHLSLLFIL